MQAKSIAECSKGSILQCFQPSFVIKIFVLSIFEWLFLHRFTVLKEKIVVLCHLSYRRSTV